MQRAVEGFGDAACDAGEGVAVAAQGDGFADGIDVVLGVQEADDGLGHGTLAAAFPLVDGVPIVVRLVEVVEVFLFDVVADLLLALPCPGQVYGRSRGLGALYPIGMVVSDCCRYRSHPLRFLEGIKEPTHSADPHCRTVAETAIWVSPCGRTVRRGTVFLIERIKPVRMKQPVIETCSIPAHRAAEAPGEHYHGILQFLITVCWV